MSSDERHTVEIDVLYQQSMTVEVPVYETPVSPEDAWHLLKNTDPEFIADVLPSSWDHAVSVGDINVVDIREADSDTHSSEPKSTYSQEDR